MKKGRSGGRGGRLAAKGNFPQQTSFHANLLPGHSRVCQSTMCAVAARDMAGALTCGANPGEGAGGRGRR
jgi:hypothetical protein